MPQEKSRQTQECRQGANGTDPVRINRYLAMCGVCSRREADGLIGAGRVLVDGKQAAAGMKITGNEEVRVDGRIVRPEERAVVLAVNKPAGVVCSTDRRWGDTLIGDIAKAEGGERLFYMGRLDKDSEGLLLLTNQGKLCDEIMRSRNGHEKEYVVTVDKPVTDAFIRRMETGVFLPELNVTTKPCKVWQGDRGTGGARGTGLLSPHEVTVDPSPWLPPSPCHPDHVFHIVLTQGLNRQIRRMCQALGYRVLRLKRIRIMNITLGNLKSGQSRELTAEEVRGLT